MSVGSLFNTIKTCTERTSRELARPPTFNKRQWTRLLSRHPQLYDASALEEQCARVEACAQLVVRQGFVVKAEQLRVKQEKEKCRQRTLESAQTEFEAMDARSFVVALQLDAAGLKRLTTEDKHRGALGSLLVERGHAASLWH